MAYIGKEPQFTQYPSKFFDGDNSAMTVTLDYAPPNDAALLVFIDGVRQDTDAYNLVGTSLTFTGAVPTGTNNVQVVHMGLTLDVGVPGDDTVTAAKIQDDAVTAAKIATNAVGNAEMADDAVGIAELSATGTASATTFLRGDNSWAVPTDTVYNDAGVQDDIALLGFKVASNGSLAKYNLVDQSVDAFEDASGVDASASTGENRNSAGKYYSGAAAASGGTITTYGSYTVHSFTSTGNTDFVVGQSGNVDVLVVAGGGGGGAGHAGGGGAGGFRTAATHAVTAQTYTVTVGAGGVGGVYSVSTCASGDDSVFDTITSTGGGFAGANNEPGHSAPIADGGDGGSGGGGSRTSSPSLHGYGGDGNTPSTSPVQGYDGGDSVVGAGNWTGAGGGGASAVGGNASGTTGGDGGNGATNDYQTGVSQTYAGGGGAGGDTAGSGGTGGGGNGGCCTGGSAAVGTPGTDGLGGGGGGSRETNGGDGGDGIVVVRYTGSLGAYANMTLVSESTTAQATPTKGDIVMTYTNGIGTATVNTDIKAYASRDNGTTYTQMTLASQGTTGGHTILTAHDVDISGQPSGTSMRYKITTHNQSASKETRIQAVSLGWS